LLKPIVIFVDNHGEERGEKGPFPEYLLDGRAQLEALSRIGIKDPRDATMSSSCLYGAIRKVQAIRLQGYLTLGGGSSEGKARQWVTETDPELYVLTANVRRRHLTAEQKRDVIAAFIKAKPQASNRAVAKTLGVSHVTVADVRKEESAPNGQVVQIEHLPVERAKAAARANPSASVSDIAKSANVGRATAQRAQKLVAVELKTEPKSELEPKQLIDAEQEMKKKAERFRAVVQKTFASWTEQWREEIGIDAMIEILREAWRTTTARH
jgi:hypothetical protein